MRSRRVVGERQPEIHNKNICASASISFVRLGKVRYRILGRTGLKVSELGFGGHEYRRPLPTTLGRWGEIDMEKFLRAQPERNRLIKRAIEAGVNYFDTTHEEEAKSLGLALKELRVRDDIHLSIMILGLFNKMAESPRSQYRQIIIDDVEEKLKSLQTDYADILTLLFPERNYSRERMAAALEVFKEIKEKEKIGFLGASSHEPRFLAELMRQYDCFDMVMVRYNYHLQEPRDVIFPLAKVLEVGVVVIKPFAWPYYGIPFMRFGPVEEEEGPYTPAQTSLRWILASPEVATVVAGVNSQAELEENLAAITKEAQIDEEVLDQYLKVAQSPQAKEKLRKMLRDPAIDIRYYAKRALSE